MELKEYLKLKFEAVSKLKKTSPLLYERFGDVVKFPEQTGDELTFLDSFAKDLFENDYNVFKEEVLRAYEEVLRNNPH